MRLAGDMNEQDSRLVEAEGETVYLLAYDEGGNQTRISPAEVTEESDVTRGFGIGDGHHEIVHIDHGPLAAAEAEVRLANIGSLAAALESNCRGSALYVDRSEPPVDEDFLDLDKRYHLEVLGGELVAVITQRYPKAPNESTDDLASSLARVVEAYGCSIRGVNLTLLGGATPESFLAPFADDESEMGIWFHAQDLNNLSHMAHEVHIQVTTDSMKKASDLIDCATALADFLKATKDGPLDADDVINLLRGGHFNLLIGETESEFLEAKAQMHPISASGKTGTKAKIELAQDVARFANGDVNAVLVVGFKEKGDGSNKIAKLTPVADNYLNIAQIIDVLDARVVPPIDGLLVEKFATSPTESVLAIYVPRQPVEMQPYLVHGVFIDGKEEGDFFSIVRRRGERSIPTTAKQIHTYIVAGKRYLRGEDGR